jgi:hypothetical protein
VAGSPRGPVSRRPCQGRRRQGRHRRRRPACGDATRGLPSRSSPRPRAAPAVAAIPRKYRRDGRYSGMSFLSSIKGEFPLGGVEFHAGDSYFG